MAMLAYSIAASAVTAADTPGTLLSSRDAGRAGSARTTASACTSSGSAADPTTSRRPSGVRLSSRTVARVLIVAPEAAATAAGSMPSPPVSVVNTAGPGDACSPGRAGGGAGISDAAASASEGYVAAAAASGPSVASNDSSSDRPA